jgi:hypothetical protein
LAEHSFFYPNTNKKRNHFIQTRATDDKGTTREEEEVEILDFANTKKIEWF